MLIVGCGNVDRSDDAAGLLVARRLSELGVDAREHPGEMLTLMDAWNGVADVILIDAVMSGAAPGAITRWDGAAPLPREPFRCSTHALGVAEAVELARALGRLPPKLILYGIEARKFDRGGSVSAEVADAVERLAQDIAGQARSQR